MKRLKYYWVFGLWGFWVMGLWGCATIADVPRGFLGVSIRVLEENRKDALSEKFTCDYNTCYENVKETLKRIGAYTYASDAKKQLLAVYVSTDDTTPVGLFFTRLDASNTQIEVSSPSTYAKELIFSKVFSALDKALNPRPQEPPSETEKKK